MLAGGTSGLNLKMATMKFIKKRLTVEGILQLMKVMKLKLGIKLEL